MGRTRLSNKTPSHIAYLPFLSHPSGVAGFKMSALIASQVICMFLLLIGTLFAGVSPIFLQKTLFKCECDSDTCKPTCRARRGKLVTAFLIYFGGGVLLGTTFLHLLPESREAFEDHAHVNCSDNSTVDGEGEEGHEHFSVPEFIVCIGFFAVYLFEEIIHYFMGGHTHVPSEHKAIRSISRTDSCCIPPPESLTSSGKHARPASPTPASPTPPAKSSENLVLDEHASESFSLSALLTVAALSFHSLFEGFAVGLRPDATSTWIVYAAVAVHKYVIAFVVGLEVLATGGRNVHVYSYMSIFSLMSPLGMAIAMITQNNLEESSPMVVSVLNGIATGTLLYVTFFEILQRNEHKDLATWIQLIATVSGFILITLVQFGSTFA